MTTPAFPGYRPPEQRRRLIRYRWIAPLLIAVGIAAFVAFALSGDPTNRTLILSEADGEERQVCASRATVDAEPGAQEGQPLLPGPVEVAPRWFVADPPADLALQLRMTPEDRVTFFDADGDVLAAFGPGRNTTANSVAIDVPWSGMLVEVPAGSDDPYTHVSETKGC